MWYNRDMKDKKLFTITFITLICGLALLFSACVSAPKNEKPQYSRWNYTFTVLHDPKNPADSHQMDIAMSLWRMNYPEPQATFFNEFLYSAADSFDTHKDNVLEEQRDAYRKKVDAAKTPLTAKDKNWRYAESINYKSFENLGMLVKRLSNSTTQTANTEEKKKKRENDVEEVFIYPGMVVDRTTETFFGGDHLLIAKRYYVLDMDELKQIKIDDLFADYQGERELRDLVYEELRKFCGLERDRPLSSGIYFTNEPEISFNFFFTEEGLGLHWDAGQIAPYEEGEIEVILLWQVIRRLMLPAGVNLLTKFNIHLFM